jgi:hypothetical protein
MTETKVVFTASLEAYSKIQLKEVQPYSRPIGRDVCAERPPVIGMNNTPGFEMSDRALDRGAQLVYLGVEFLLPVQQLPALRLLERGDEVRALITLVADPAVGGRNDICSLRGLFRRGCQVCDKFPVSGAPT